jgi:hypothetical protein
MTLPLILLIISIAARSCAELALHGKLRWSDGGTGFWGEESWKRKYKNFDRLQGERWPTSTWLTVNFTDGVHACQSVSFLTLAASLSIALPLNFLIVWPIILVTHAGVYKILSR